MLNFPGQGRGRPGLPTPPGPTPGQRPMPGRRPMPGPAPAPREGGAQEIVLGIRAWKQTHGGEQTPATAEANRLFDRILALIGGPARGPATPQPPRPPMGGPMPPMGGIR